MKTGVVVCFSELLKRLGGTYRQTLVIQPGNIAENMTVRASFAELQGFTYFGYTLPGNDTELTSSSDADAVSDRRRGTLMLAS